MNAMGVANHFESILNGLASAAAADSARRQANRAGVDAVSRVAYALADERQAHAHTVAMVEELHEEIDVAQAQIADLEASLRFALARARNAEAALQQLPDAGVI